MWDVVTLHVIAVAVAGAAGLGDIESIDFGERIGYRAHSVTAVTRRPGLNVFMNAALL
jgi:hypothetical protein